MCKSTMCSLATIVLIALAGCSQPPAKQAEAPAKVAHEVKEGQLNTIVLSQNSEKHLGVEVAALQSKSLPLYRTYGGEVTLPPSAVVAISAPVSGTLKLADKSRLITSGSRVKKGTKLYDLLPQALTQAEKVAFASTRLQLAQAKINAEEKLKQSKIQLDAAEIVYQSAEALLIAEAGTRQSRDDAKANYELAQKAFDASKRSFALVDAIKIDDDLSRPLSIQAPMSGIVRTTFAEPGEILPAGAPLFEIMDTSIVWIKVPVFVGEMKDISQDAAAQVNSWSASLDAAGMKATPAKSPPTAQAQASAIDLYYGLANDKEDLRPGQRVRVRLPLTGEQQRLVVPWRSVIHDVNGGTWVYVKTAERTYARQRIQVERVEGDQAVLAPPPAGASHPLASGTEIITAGAAEVFGTEFGFGKSH